LSLLRRNQNIVPHCLLPSSPFLETSLSTRCTRGAHNRLGQQGKHSPRGQAALTFPRVTQGNFHMRHAINFNTYSYVKMPVNDSCRAIPLSPLRDVPRAGDQTDRGLTPAPQHFL